MAATSFAVYSERFAAKYEVDPETGCWNWTAGVDPSGYGRFGFLGRRSALAHRVALQLYGFIIPWDRPDVDHLCRNRRCVNPEHLEAVTHAENLRRGAGFPGLNARKTRCSAGHELDEANTYIKPDGTRRCRACHAKASARYRARSAE